jgi:hypothetical protein
MQIRAKFSPVFIFLMFVTIMLGVMCATAIAQQPGQPVSATAAPNKTVVIAVAADGTPPLSYQWTKAGVDIPGATTASITLRGVTAEASGVYACKISNAYGLVISPTATLSVGSAPSTQGTVITITIQ